jgi:hypothetical protein
MAAAQRCRRVPVLLQLLQRRTSRTPSSCPHLDLSVNIHTALQGAIVLKDAAAAGATTAGLLSCRFMHT